MDRDAVRRLWASLSQAPAGTPGQDKWCLSKLVGLCPGKRSWAVGVEVQLQDVVRAGGMRPDEVMNDFIWAGDEADRCREGFLRKSGVLLVQSDAGTRCSVICRSDH